MSRRYASGKYAQAICDRCGDSMMYKDLRREPKTNLMVCRECLDMPHPQDYPTTSHFADPEAIENARPDTEVTAGSGVASSDYAGTYAASGADPIGKSFTTPTPTFSLGTVTVVIS